MKHIENQKDVLNLATSAFTTAFLESVLSTLAPPTFRPCKLPLVFPAASHLHSTKLGDYVEGIVKSVSLGTFISGVNGSSSFDAPLVLPLTEDVRATIKLRPKNSEIVASALCAEISVQCWAGEKERVVPIVLCLGSFSSTLGVSSFAFTRACKNALVDTFLTFERA